MSEIFASAKVFTIPMVHRFRGTTVREGMVLRGPAGVGEFAPFLDYSDADALPWLRAALEAATIGFPSPRRHTIAINAIVPVVSPSVAAELVRASGCRTVKVKVADPGVDLGADADRLRAVRDSLGPAGKIRIDANGLWSVEEALAAIRTLEQAAGGLEYVEQPCATVPELAAVRAAVDVPIAADESIRRAADPLAVARAGAADIAVVKVAPLGGISRLLRIAADCGLPVVVSSAVDTAVGLAAGLAAAAALPNLPYACGFGTSSLLTADVSSQLEAPVDGTLGVPRRAPEPDLMDAVRADPERTRFWRQRLARVAALLDPAESPE